MVNGLPVICNTPADGTELDMIENGKNGILIESMDSQKLVEALKYMVENKNYLKMKSKSLDKIRKTYNINIDDDTKALIAALPTPSAPPVALNP